MPAPVIPGHITHGVILLSWRRHPGKRVGRVVSGCPGTGRGVIARTHWVSSLPFFNQSCSRCPRPDRTHTMSAQAEPGPDLTYCIIGLAELVNRALASGLWGPSMRVAWPMDWSSWSVPLIGSHLLLPVDPACPNRPTGVPLTGRDAPPRQAATFFVAESYDVDSRSQQIHTKSDAPVRAWQSIQVR